MSLHADSVDDGQFLEADDVGRWTCVGEGHRGILQREASPHLFLVKAF